MDRNTLVYERLHEVLNYEPETGEFTWKEMRNGRAMAGQIAGRKANNGYTQIGVDDKLYLAHRLAWLYVHGYLPENNIDHINHIRDDNRIMNLREVSQSCNMRNAKTRINNNSGVCGVSWHSKSGKWHSQICSKSLGYYDNFDEAICCRLAVEQCIGWEGCDSTSSAYLYVQKMLWRG